MVRSGFGSEARAEVRVRRLLLTLMLAVACTLLSLFANRVVYRLTEPCSPGATCAAPVREAGWPLAFSLQAVAGQEEATARVDPAQLGWQTAPFAVNVLLYGLLLLLLGRMLPSQKRTEARFS